MVTRREFLKYCTACAAYLGLTQSGLSRLEAALGNGAPTIIWLHGSGCQGDSVSFLNLFTDVDPVGHLDVGSVLINHVNLAYHTVVMASAADAAVTMAMQAKRKGGYVLVLEGGVPAAFNGRACLVMTNNGKEVTYRDAILDLATNAAVVLNVGTCACYGGIPMSGPDPSHTNPTGIVSCWDFVKTNFPAKTVINIPGCPSHPDWVGWAVVQLILGNSVTLDNYGRPTALFGNKDVDLHTLNVHENCPRNPNRPGGNDLATTFGQDGLCLENLGCRGPSTFSDCPVRKWNNGETGPANWCVDSNGMCFGCVEPDFPGGSFYL